jgi:phenylacetate-CoA ligase
MFETAFVAGGRRTRLQLPFRLDDALEDWSALRSAMTRGKPGAFLRDEWAYLIGFLDRDFLEGVFREAFGDREPAEHGPSHVEASPGGPVALWLPNNVGLLGALTLILLSLTGNEVRIKAGSRADDLTRLFLDYASTHLRQGELRDHLARRVTVEVFSREDPRNAAWASTARTRIAFGSDAGVAAVQALPHPAESLGFSFGHRVSQAWIEPAACDDPTLESLLRVFAIYGQAACTSPGRVVLLDAAREEAFALRDRMLVLWKKIFPRAPETAVASASILDHQWARAEGWDSRLAEGHGAAIAVGSAGLDPPAGQRILPLTAMTTAQALARLPGHIQTIGHAVSPERARALPSLLAPRGVKRFVPVEAMHRFGPVWDGEDFWRQTFALREAAS